MTGGKRASRAMRMAVRRLGLALCLLVCCALGGCGQAPEPYTEIKFLMDTVVTLTLRGDDPQQLARAAASAWTRFAEVADVTDRYAAHGAGDLYHLNQAAGQGNFSPAPLLRDILRLVGSQHHPALDVTVGPVVDVWRAHGARKTVPTKDEVAAARAQTGAGAYTLQDDGSVTLAKGASLDLGAVAKGYAVERAAAALATEHAVQSAVVNAGGNVKTVGSKLGGAPWRIGIQHPRQADALLGTLALAGGRSVATSGDYQRYYEVDGVRYHHIVDPQTGYPARGNISATAVCESAARADYYSTVLFVLPLAEARALVERTDDLEAVILTDGGELYVSPGLRQAFTAGGPARQASAPQGERSEASFQLP